MKLKVIRKQEPKHINKYMIEATLLFVPMYPGQPFQKYNVEIELKNETEIREFLKEFRVFYYYSDFKSFEIAKKSPIYDKYLKEGFEKAFNFYSEDYYSIEQIEVIYYDKNGVEYKIREDFSPEEKRESDYKIMCLIIDYKNKNIEEELQYIKEEFKVTGTDLKLTITTLNDTDFKKYANKRLNFYIS